VRNLRRAPGRSGKAIFADEFREAVKFFFGFDEEHGVG
jgi:hypothetical protein